LAPSALDPRPVLYLDLDDTLVCWRGGHPRAAPGARDFVRWALARFEVRWLTTWCPDGEMADSLLLDLARLLEVQPSTLRHIRGFDWAASESKLNGIAWLEHLVLGRPFVWLEDNYGVQAWELGFLERHGLLPAYRRVNVTEDPDSLRRVHQELEREFGAPPD
jgi:hypothetical protein